MWPEQWNQHNSFFFGQTFLSFKTKEICEITKIHLKLQPAVDNVKHYRVTNGYKWKAFLVTCGGWYFSPQNIINIFIFLSWNDKVFAPHYRCIIYGWEKHPFFTICRIGPRSSSFIWTKKLLMLADCSSSSESKNYL